MTKLKEGYGYWRTDRYPIGGEFHRAGHGGLDVELTGKRIDFGKWNGYVEFRVPAWGMDKEFTGYTDKNGFIEEGEKGEQ